MKAAFDFELHSMLIVTSKRGVTFKDLPTSVRNSFGDFLATVIQLVGTSYYPWELNHRKYIEQYFCNVHEIYFYMYEDEAARNWLKHTGSHETLFSLVSPCYIQSSYLLVTTYPMPPRLTTGSASGEENSVVAHGSLFEMNFANKT